MEYKRIESKIHKELVALFTKAFTESEGKDEGIIIGNLVSDLISKTDSDDLHIFVATQNGKTLASAIFSRIKFEKSKAEAFLMAPVAVDPDYQRKGIGVRLISFANENLKKRSVELLFTYGDINFYSKVGYKTISENLISAPLKLTSPEGWLAQSVDGHEIKPISGRSYCVEAIDDPKYW
ncbi:MAG: N-acetyltransferase [Candidatus Dojkabacteria bacterium]|nr:N-acetyltransferase [Candidatus Dojkabacteria bacterium]